MQHKRALFSSSAFTLIELLVVIAIIAILAVVVVLTLNPAQLLAQSRDANRVSDMATLNSAIGLYQIDSGGTGSLGTSSIVYTSLSDTSFTCGNLNLPILPSGYTYNCTNSTSTRNINTSGWIPINFQTISSGAPFGSLPVDPTNTSSSRLYYTYDTNGSQYEVTASMESSKYKLGGSNDVISSDGGTLASVYEKGTGLGLEPLDYGDSSLVGYWPMNEGSGSTSGVTQAYDRSGNGNNGTWYGTAAGTSGYYSPGKVGAWAGTFDGSTNYVKVNNFNVPSTISLSFWINVSILSTSTALRIIDDVNGSHTPFSAGVGTASGGQGKICFNNTFNDFSTPFICSGTGAISNNMWYHVVDEYDGATAWIYVNGVGVASTTYNKTFLSGYSTFYIGADMYHFSGLLDDVRIYNRALSAAEIQAMYNAGK
jgi:prepilin-type N-terminal cleavage/methylation domain-containing protein